MINTWLITDFSNDSGRILAAAMLACGDMRKASEAGNPPLQLPFGLVAYKSTRAKFVAFQEATNAWEADTTTVFER